MSNQTVGADLRVRPIQYDVRIGQKCRRCSRDFWRVKRAFKVCACGMKCWLFKILLNGNVLYRYFQGENPPPGAVVTTEKGEKAYRGGKKTAQEAILSAGTPDPPHDTGVG